MTTRRDFLKELTAAGLALWVGTYLIGQLTPWMLSALTPSGTFLLFAVMCVPYVLIMWRCVPETAGMSLDVIGRKTRNNKQYAENF